MIILMQVFMTVTVNDIYANSYVGKDGKTRTYYNLEVKNPEPDNYNRYLNLGIDNECWSRLGLNEDKAKFIGKKCELLCDLIPFQKLYRVNIKNISIK